MGKEVQSAEIGVLLSEPTPLVEVEQQELGAVVRWMLEACCVLHYPSPKVLFSFLAVCRVLGWALHGYLPGEDLESGTHVPFPALIHSSFSYLSGRGRMALIPALKSYQLKVERI